MKIKPDTQEETKKGLADWGAQRGTAQQLLLYGGWFGLRFDHVCYILSYSRRSRQARALDTNQVEEVDKAPGAYCAVPTGKMKN